MEDKEEEGNGAKDEAKGKGRTGKINEGRIKRGKRAGRKIQRREK